MSTKISLPIYSFDYFLEKAHPSEKQPLLPEKNTNLNDQVTEIASEQTDYPATTHKFEENQCIRKGMEQFRSEKEIKNKMNDVSDLYLAQIAKFDFIKQLREGKIDVDRIRQHFKNLECIHEALEKGQLKLLEKGIDDFVFPKLWKGVALKKDIEAWGAGDKAPTPDAYDYAQYVLNLAEERPAFFILHLFSIYKLHFCDAMTLKDKIQSAYEKLIGAKKAKCGTNAFCYQDIQTTDFDTIWRLELNKLFERFRPAPSFLEYRASCISEVQCLFSNFIKIVKL